MLARSRPLVVLLFLLIALNAIVNAQTALTGTIVGRVQDQDSKNALPGATVTVDGSRLRVTCDHFGEYQLVGVPAGAHVLKVSFLGYNAYSIDVNVKAGVAIEVNALMLPVVAAERRSL